MHPALDRATLAQLSAVGDLGKEFATGSRLTLRFDRIGRMSEPPCSTREGRIIIR